MSDFDFEDFIDFFGENENTIKTTEIRDLFESIYQWIARKNQGAIIYGKPRVGKTRALELLSKELQQKYGEQYPVYILYLSGQDNIGKTERYFYVEMLRALHQVSSRNETAQTLKRRIINTISADAVATNTRTAVLIVDEAQYMDNSRYSWLKAIYDELKHGDAKSDTKGISLVVLLVGMDNLMKIRQQYIHSESSYIAARFMTKTFQFSGIKGPESMMEILKVINDELDYFVDGERINVMKQLFPKSFANGKSLLQLAVPIWDAFNNYAKKLAGVKLSDETFKVKEITMQAFMNCITMIFQEYSAYSASGEEVWPTKALIKRCVEESGFDVTG